MAVKNSEHWRKICKKIYKTVGVKDKEFGRFLLDREYMGGVHFDPYTWYRLYNVWKPVKFENADRLMIFSGNEGMGKSTLAIKCAAALDPNFSSEEILYTPDNLPNLLRRIKKEKKPGRAILMDEGNLFLFSREAMSGGNKQMVKMFALMRQLNCFLLVCVPSFFTVDSYLREHRVNDFFFVFKRGQFHCYKKEAIQKISFEGAKAKNVLSVNIPYEWFYTGSVSKRFPATVDEKDYKDIKGDNFEEFIDELEMNISSKSNKEKKKVEIHKEEEKTVPVKHIVQETGLHHSTVIEHIKQGKLEAKRIGKKYYVDKDSYKNYKEGKTSIAKRIEKKMEEHKQTIERSSKEELRLRIKESLGR
jgi:ribosomal protein S24E